MEQPSTTATMPEPTAATPVIQEPVQSAPVAPPTHSDTGAGTAEPVEETLGNIDPKSLPPELKQKYDSMLGDYKKKTAELANQRKDYETVAERAKLVDMITSDPEFVTWWNNKYSSGQAQPQGQPSYADPALKAEVDTLKASLLLKDFKAAHPDFDDLDKDSLITGYVKLNPPQSEREWQKTLDKAYAYASDLRNRWREEGKKEGLTRVQEKSAQSSMPPSSTAPNTFQGDNKKVSVSEAIDMAKRGIKLDPSRW
jgi:hypothetical protein